jgi:hypothetical protein
MFMTVTWDKKQARLAARSYCPKIFIILPCGHAVESFRSGDVGDPISRDTVPTSARTVEENRLCAICDPELHAQRVAVIGMTGGIK